MDTFCNPRSTRFDVNTNPMSLLSKNSPILTPQNEIWYIIKIYIPKKITITPSTIIRKLTNSKQTTSRTTNRNWWEKNVTNGFVVNYINKEGLKMEINIQVREELHFLDVKTRIKKICGLTSEVEIFRTDEIRFPDILITIQPIKNGYQKIKDLTTFHSELLTSNLGYTHRGRKKQLQ